MAAAALTLARTSRVAAAKRTANVCQLSAGPRLQARTDKTRGHTIYNFTAQGPRVPPKSVAPALGSIRHERAFPSPFPLCQLSSAERAQWVFGGHARGCNL
eukprot:scaffold87818_cov36-Tisochrysis_lutea.AAC.6